MSRTFTMALQFAAAILILGGSTGQAQEDKDKKKKGDIDKFDGVGVAGGNVMGITTVERKKKDAANVTFINGKDLDVPFSPEGSGECAVKGHEKKARIATFITVVPSNPENKADQPLAKGVDTGAVETVNPLNNQKIKKAGSTNFIGAIWAIVMECPDSDVPAFTVILREVNTTIKRKAGGAGGL